MTTAVFDCPRQFDVERTNLRKSMTFGAGVHLCLGIALARMQLLVAARQTARRLGDLSLAVPIEDIRYLPNAALLAMESLPLAFTRPTAQTSERLIDDLRAHGHPVRPEELDIPALRDKYREERERRLRPEGQEQYAASADRPDGTVDSRPAHGSVARATGERGRRCRRPWRRLGRRSRRLPP